MQKIFKRKTKLSKTLSRDWVNILCNSMKKAKYLHSNIGPTTRVHTYVLIFNTSQGMRYTTYILFFSYNCRNT